MSLKNKIAKRLNEYGDTNKKHVVMTSDKYREMEDELEDDTVVKIVDETPVDEVNQEVMDKFVKQYGEEKGKQYYYATANKQDRDPEDFHTEAEEVGGEQVNVPKLQADVQKFMDKLNLGQFKNIIAKIDKPIEKAELIAAFAERIGVPRAKLPMMISSLKMAANTPEVSQQQPVENVKPRMKKSALEEQVLKNKR